MWATVCTFLVCCTLLGMTHMVCHIGVRFTQEITNKLEREQDTFSPPMTDETDDERSQAYQFAREMQSLFIDEDQMEGDSR